MSYAELNKWLIYIKPANSKMLSALREPGGPRTCSSRFLANWPGPWVLILRTWSVQSSIRKRKFLRGMDESNSSNEDKQKPVSRDILTEFITSSIWPSWTTSIDLPCVLYRHAPWNFFQGTDHDREPAAIYSTREKRNSANTDSGIVIVGLGSNRGPRDSGISQWSQVK